VSVANLNGAAGPAGVSRAAANNPNGIPRNSATSTLADTTVVFKVLSAKVLICVNVSNCSKLQS